MSKIKMLCISDWLFCEVVMSSTVLNLDVGFN